MSEPHRQKIRCVLCGSPVNVVGFVGTVECSLCGSIYCYEEGMSLNSVPREVEDVVRKYAMKERGKDEHDYIDSRECD